MLLSIIEGRPYIYLVTGVCSCVYCFQCVYNDEECSIESRVVFTMMKTWHSKLYSRYCISICTLVLNVDGRCVSDIDG